MTDLTPQSHGSIAVLSRDLFFGMRIRNALKQMGYVPRLITTVAELAGELAEPDCVLALVDFNDEVDWPAIRQSIEGHQNLAVIAFGPHTDVDGFKAAREAGATRVISNGAFSQQLPDLVARHARKR